MTWSKMDRQTDTEQRDTKDLSTQKGSGNTADLNESGTTGEAKSNTLNMETPNSSK